MTDREFNDRLLYEIFIKPAQVKKEKDERIIDFISVWAKVEKDERIIKE